ncbi:SLC13 family permease [Spirochaeta isovalerica]|uniref:Sodium-dependent dicarboxylate transporter 2/3/5 n=1 Tax=Spirochaeta isovalerica TaxID=150 RepID=A0A841RJ13_9SPIO|nr:DASS family sodium-coupled anion symporter [Spirochaeta isovalerica]MBB6482508.1 sodium-dependent dicarboxylate transporter 2/3/5 [Spirochaeta isovalerica]
MTRETGKKITYFSFASLVMIVMMVLPIPDSIRNAGKGVLTQEGQIAMGLLLFCLVLWMTEAIPFHITGMLGVVLLAVFRVDTFKNIVSVGFGNHIIAFFIGVLILSAFITKSGLGKRISVYLLSRTGNSTAMIIFGFMLVGALLSMWITNMAVAAMLLPLGVAILEEEGCLRLKSNFGKALMIASVWGPLIGGIGTPAGAGPNPIAIGFLKEIAGVDLSFTQWMMFGVPAVFLLLPIGWILLMILFKPEIKHLKKTREELRHEFDNYPPMSREEKLTLVIFLITVVLWLTSGLLGRLLGIAIPTSMPVLFTATLFFFPGVTSLKWKEIEEDVSWSGIILVVSGISIGMMLYQSGAAGWLSFVLLGGIGSLSPLVRVGAIVLIVMILKVALSSNSVTATIVIPIMIALADNLGFDALSITLPASITASLAFILVTSSPTNVIPYSAGYFSIRDFAKSGIIMTVFTTIIVSLVIYTVGSFTGLY